MATREMVLCLVLINRRMRSKTLVCLATAILSSCGTSSVSRSPWKIALRQPQIHVQVSPGCPTTLAKAEDVSNTGAGLDKTLVPLNPQSGLICRFGPASADGQMSVAAGMLYRHQQLDTKTSRHLASVIDSISTAAPKGVTSCPAEIGSASIIVFSYTDARDADLWFSDSGCRTLDNGLIGAFEPGNPGFYQGFESLIDELCPQRP
jgi:hypothetical protein